MKTQHASERSPKSGAKELKMPVANLGHTTYDSNPHWCTVVRRRHATVLRVGRRVVDTPREKLDVRQLMAAPGRRGW